MPLALVAALVASMALHGALLFLPEVDLAPLARELEPQTLQATLVAPLKAPQAAAPVRPAQPAAKPKPKPRHPAAAVAPAPNHNPQPIPAPTREPAEAAVPESLPTPEALSQEAASPTEQSRASDGTLAEFPPRGVIRYRVYRGTQGLEVGRAIHRWAVGGGRYQFQSITETTGLAALLRPVRLETESRGSIGPRGLVPEEYRVEKNGQPSEESASFDWEREQVKIAGRELDEPLRPGSQDLLSLHYQLAYLPDLSNGAAFWVATGKKYEQFNFDALGEEVIQLPAGSFRTLHLQSLTGSRTELWLALDHLLLPVKIRHTDKKGEVFEQVAVQLDLNIDLPE